MKVLSLDFETSWTTPVNPRQCRIFEVGAVLFDWELRMPIKIYSELTHDEDHPISPKELVDLTGITDDLKREWGVPLKQALTDLFLLFDSSDYIIAHNGNEFDKPLLYAEAERMGMAVPAKPWIDSKVDIDYAAKIQSRKLTHLCSEHGFLNPFSHRALFDALAVLKILQAYPIDDVIASSKEPNCQVIASVSYTQKDLAKVRGYYWNGEEKYWWKSMKLNKAQKEKEEAPFPVQIRQIET